MKDYKKYKQAIEAMIENLGESDSKILIQIYTILKTYLKRRGR